MITDDKEENKPLLLCYDKKKRFSITTGPYTDALFANYWNEIVGGKYLNTIESIDEVNKIAKEPVRVVEELSFEQLKAKENLEQITASLELTPEQSEWLNMLITEHMHQYGFSANRVFYTI